jgi:hypothetical protein
MMIKVSGTISVARIHHQYVMARRRPSGLKNIVLRKDYVVRRGGKDVSKFLRAE